MELHTHLRDDVLAFDFRYADFSPARQAYPDLTVIDHPDLDSLTRDMHKIELLATWKFERSWYDKCPSLKAIFTPAAGTDWIAPDPAGRVAVHHGTFHGPILAESLLGAILHMNRLMPAMLEAAAQRQWDRNLQAETRLLRNQAVVIIGFGHIGTACARLLRRTGARVIGIKRTPARQSWHPDDVEIRTVDGLESALTLADHAVLLLPGDPSTDRFMNKRRLQQLKEGAYIYNFGRGNSLIAEDLIPALRDGRLGGAFLDVTEEEPLPADSPLWSEANVVITPHSSCVCSEYKAGFVEELVPRLGPWMD